MLCAVLPLLLAATPAPTRAMTLAEARGFAREHQPSLMAVRAALQGAQADAKVPRALWLPRLGGTVQLLAGTTNNSTASYYTSPYVDLVRIGSTPVTTSPSGIPSPSTLAALGLKQELFDFGRISAL